MFFPHTPAGLKREGRYPVQSLTRASGIQKHPDEIKHPGVAYSLLSMAYQRATRLEPCGSDKTLAVAGVKKTLAVAWGMLKLARLTHIKQQSPALGQALLRKRLFKWETSNPFYSSLLIFALG